MSDVKYPNETTKKALAELEAGKGEKFDDVAALMADLHEAASRGLMVTQKFHQATVI